MFSGKVAVLAALARDVESLAFIHLSNSADVTKAKRVVHMPFSSIEVTFNFTVSSVWVQIFAMAWMHLWSARSAFGILHFPAAPGKNSIRTRPALILVWKKRMVGR